jgi:hypothetical protein
MTSCDIVFDVMGSAKLETSIKEYFSPVLRGQGFKGSGRTFRRLLEGWLHVINFQVSMSGGQFAVNLAIHPIVVTDVRGRNADHKTMLEYDCEFRIRMSDSEEDKWWDYGSSQESMNIAVMDTVKVFQEKGEKFFQRFAGQNSELLTLTVSDFELGNFRKFGFMTTDVRAAFVLAKFYRATGRLSEAQSFAKYALANIGRGVSLQKELENICNFI